MKACTEPPSPTVPFLACLPRAVPLTFPPPYTLACLSIQGPRESHPPCDICSSLLRQWKQSSTSPQSPCSLWRGPAAWLRPACLRLPRSRLSGGSACSSPGPALRRTSAIHRSWLQCLNRWIPEIMASNRPLSESQDARGLRSLRRAFFSVWTLRNYFLGRAFLICSS